MNYIVFIVTILFHHVSTAAQANEDRIGEASAVCSRLKHNLSVDARVYMANAKDKGENESYNMGAFNLTQFQNTWQMSACVIEPSTPADLGMIMSEVVPYKIPFAFRGEGINPSAGYLATSGILILMKQFSTVSIARDRLSVNVGSGATWGDVYRVLNGTGLNVVGGRLSDIGVGGSLAAGSWSWLTQQHGLGIDNINSFNIVLANGTYLEQVSDQYHPDLFWACKGAGHSFGLITQYNLKAYAQGPVYVGVIMYTDADVIQTQVIPAVADFIQNNTDTKAQLIYANHVQAGMIIVSSVTFMYDGQKAPSGIFSSIEVIPAMSSTVATQSFADFVASTVVSLGGAPRSSINSLPLAKINKDVLHIAYEMASNYGGMEFMGAVPFMTNAYAPILPSFSKYSKDAAYMPRTVQSNEIMFGWAIPTNDKLFVSKTVTFRDEVRQRVKDTSLPYYPGYASLDTPPKDMFSDIPRLARTQAIYDPGMLMVISGGFNFSADSANSKTHK